jgi:hypothetical protein
MKGYSSGLRHALQHRLGGNGLALSTGTAGCSAYQIESKPSRSAFRAMKAGSMV